MSPLFFFLTFQGIFLLALSVVLALDSLLLWLLYQTLLRLTGQSFYPERAREYQTLQYVVYGLLSSAALYASLRAARRWQPRPGVLRACWVCSALAVGAVATGLDSRHLAAGLWTALPVCATALLAGWLALRASSLSASGRGTP